MYRNPNDKPKIFGLAKASAAGVSVAVLGIFCLPSLTAKQSSISERMTVDSSPPIREGALGGYSRIVDRVAPSVVSISASKAAPQMTTGDPRLDRFFGMRPSPQNQPSQQGTGSGVIMTSDGYIVTNNHVVADADEISVALSGRKKPYEAKIVGQDPQSDIAVLKIEATDLPTIAAADSSVLKVGDTVLALGSPFGLSETVTTGIVSALGRNDVSIAAYENFIQTDASINPGNSGGALVDNKGRLVGINTAILSRSGGNVGIGFAIPVNMVLNVADQLIAHGEMKRGYLGVLLRELTPDLARAFDVPSDKGVLIDQVFPNTPADQAGLRDGDVILKVGEVPATDVRETRLYVSQRRPGSELSVEVQRGSKKLDLNVTIGELDSPGLASNTVSPRQRPGASLEPTTLIDGVTTEELTDRYRQALNLESGVQGVVITKVDPSSAAASKGLQARDVITEIGRTAVASLADAEKAIESIKGDMLLLRVWREGTGRFVALQTS